MLVKVDARVLADAELLIESEVETSANRRDSLTDMPAEIEALSRVDSLANMLAESDALVEVDSLNEVLAEIEALSNANSALAYCRS